LDRTDTEYRSAARTEDQPSLQVSNASRNDVEKDSKHGAEQRGSGDIEVSGREKVGRTAEERGHEIEGMAWTDAYAA
jgi:hypothetical protein